MIYGIDKTDVEISTISFTAYMDLFIKYTELRIKFTDSLLHSLFIFAYSLYITIVNIVTNA